MPYKLDVRDDAVVAWHLDADGSVRAERDADYQPEMHVAADSGPLADLRAVLDDDPKVARTETVRKFTTLQADEREPVLRVALDRPSEVRTLAREIRGLHERGEYAPGTFRLYDVDYAPQFRYCVETDTDPSIPENVALSTLELRTTRKRLADDDLSKLAVDGEPMQASEDVLLDVVATRLAETDPDVLIVSHGELVPALYRIADDHGRDDFDLGRRPGWTTLAGESTYESYGETGHSPARYDLPGRVLLDESNSFLWGTGGLPGLRYLVRRSHKPLQEVGWASIGNVLTAMQIREARERDVLVPWDKWQPETFKDVRTLHAADRGGFTFAPEVGYHEHVAEVDFASLYPRIICEHDVSPDTVLCDCHADRSDVPGLDYNVCDDPGEEGAFLPAVLQPQLDDRARFKRELADETHDSATEATLEGKVDAIKWILVSCFGYQGYRNAKFGRIECHEAINAIARDLLLRAKDTVEAHGWRVVHGIVDSLWITPAEDGSEPSPLEAVTEAITADADIALEHEATYDWLCFVPKRTAPAGALNRYFGKQEDGEFKLRGIEARQRSTCPFVADVQADLLEALDRHREPEPVCDVLQRHRRDLRAGDVDAEELLVTRRASKARSAYDHETRTVAVLTRAEDAGLDPRPGQSFDFLVVDDDASRTRERVRLDFEIGSDAAYDVDFYEGRLLRAAESVLSPLGWDESRIRRYLADTEAIRLSAFQDG